MQTFSDGQKRKVSQPRIETEGLSGIGLTDHADVVGDHAEI
jgi:hypothetical protein